MRTTELVTCSQTTSRPSASSVMPLPLLDGLATSRTPSCSSQRRRTSPGMSLNSRYPAGFQIGPSVKVKPVPRRSSSSGLLDQLEQRRRIDLQRHPRPLSRGGAWHAGANLTRASCRVPPLQTGQQHGEFLQAGQVVAGHETIDERQRGAHAAGQRLVSRAALQRGRPTRRRRRLGAGVPSPGRAGPRRPAPSRRTRSARSRRASGRADPRHR